MPLPPPSPLRTHLGSPTGVNEVLREFTPAPGVEWKTPIKICSTVVVKNPDMEIPPMNIIVPGLKPKTTVAAIAIERWGSRDLLARIEIRHQRGSTHWAFCWAAYLAWAVKLREREA